MKCLAYSQKKERCKNKVKWYFPFCRHHYNERRLLLFLFFFIPSVVSDYSGIFHDFFESPHDSKAEEAIRLVNHLNTKADTINNDIEEVISVIQDSNHKTTLKNIKTEFNHLHSNKTNAILNGKDSLSHILTSKIHKKSIEVETIIKEVEKENEIKNNFKISDKNIFKNSQTKINFTFNNFMETFKIDPKLDWNMNEDQISNIFKSNEYSTPFLNIGLSRQKEKDNNFDKSISEYINTDYFINYPTSVAILDYGELGIGDTTIVSLPMMNFSYRDFELNPSPIIPIDNNRRYEDKNQIAPLIKLKLDFMEYYPSLEGIETKVKVLVGI